MADFNEMLKDLFNRAIKTMAQVFVLLIGASAVASEAGVTDWSTLKRAGYALAGAGLSAATTILTKVARNICVRMAGWVPHHAVPTP